MLKPVYFQKTMIAIDGLTIVASSNQRIGWKSLTQANAQPNSVLSANAINVWLMIPELGEYILKKISDAATVDVMNGRKYADVSQ